MFFYISRSKFNGYRERPVKPLYQNLETIFDHVPYLKLYQYIILRESFYHFEQCNGVEKLGNGEI